MYEHLEQYCTFLIAFSAQSTMVNNPKKKPLDKPWFNDELIRTYFHAPLILVVVFCLNIQECKQHVKFMHIWKVVNSKVIIVRVMTFEVNLIGSF